jgi:hypothetical protein
VFGIIESILSEDTANCYHSNDERVEQVKGPGVIHSMNLANFYVLCSHSLRVDSTILSLPCMSVGKESLELKRLTASSWAKGQWRKQSADP